MCIIRAFPFNGSTINGNVMKIVLSRMEPQLFSFIAIACIFKQEMIFVSHNLPAPIGIPLFTLSHVDNVAIHAAVCDHRRCAGCYLQSQMISFLVGELVNGVCPVPSAFIIQRSYCAPL